MDILKSIKPQLCEKIVSGECTIIVSKSVPKKVSTPFKCFIYKTKSCPGLDDGKVIGEFVCNRIEVYHSNERGWYDYSSSETCLSCADIAGYGKGKTLYGWHISNLKIYDNPRTLNTFGIKCENANEIRCRDCLNKNDSDFCEKMIKPLTRPPQLWCYVEGRT